MNRWNYSASAIYRNKKLLSDTIMVLKARKSRSEKELLNLSKLFRKPSIILVEGSCEDSVQILNREKQKFTDKTQGFQSSFEREGFPC